MAVEMIGGHMSVVEISVWCTFCPTSPSTPRSLFLSHTHRVTSSPEPQSIKRSPALPVITCWPRPLPQAQEKRAQRAAGKPHDICVQCDPGSRSVTQPRRAAVQRAPGRLRHKRSMWTARISELISRNPITQLFSHTPLPLHWYLCVCVWPTPRASHATTPYTAIGRGIESS